eukprot:8980167-Pyramimonas_sp.AAC.1
MIPLFHRLCLTSIAQHCEIALIEGALAVAREWSPRQKRALLQLYYNCYSVVAWTFPLLCAWVPSLHDCVPDEKESLYKEAFLASYITRNGDE